MSLKFTGELCVMTMKNDAKFGQELTGQFKIDMRNLIIFDSTIQKSQILFSNLKSHSKTDFCFQNDMRNLANFDQGMFESLKIGTSIGSFYPKQKIYESVKFTGELCVMTMKNNAKFEQELTGQFKT